MYLHSHLRSAEEVIRVYDGKIPFSAWLKNYFKQHKKFGSKDRKTVGDLCYCYYRLGKAFAEKPVEERLLLAQFLCHTNSVFVNVLKPEWESHAGLSANQKIQFIGADISSIFPLSDELSDEIQRDDFILSHLVQPDLFLRIRPNKRENVLQKLEKASVVFTEEDNCVRLPITSKVDELLELDKDVVVQDKSSQQVLNLFQPPASNRQLFTAWDCCAASGGKTILLHDLFPKAQLTVSDIRESILLNLRNRFKRAGIQQYRSFVADVSSKDFSSEKKYDVIICDAPCSGSGTWGRTPEQLAFFTKERMASYTSLQKSIAVNASKSVKEGGAFVYITCSVFRKENEEVVDFILQKTSLKPVSQQYAKGYAEKADTLFTALFTL